MEAPLSAVYIYSDCWKPCFASALHRENSSSIDTGALLDAALVGGISLNSALWDEEDRRDVLPLSSPCEPPETRAPVTTLTSSGRKIMVHDGPYSVYEDVMRSEQCMLGLAS